MTGGSQLKNLNFVYKMPGLAPALSWSVCWSLSAPIVLSIPSLYGAQPTSYYQDLKEEGASNDPPHISFYQDYERQTTLEM